MNPLFRFFVFTALLVAPFTFTSYVSALQLNINQVSGQILLSVEEHGEAWYVDPVTLKRYYLRDGDSAYQALRTYGLGITNENLSKIPVGVIEAGSSHDTDGDGLFDALEVGLGTDILNSDSDDDGYSDYTEIISGNDPMSNGSLIHDSSLVNNLRGRILLQVERNGEAWYVHPTNGLRYYLANGQAAYDVMRFLGLGITRNDLVQISIATGSAPDPIASNPVVADPVTTDPVVPDPVATNPVSSTGTHNADLRTMTTRTGIFPVNVITMDRDAFILSTHVAQHDDCAGGCEAMTVAQYVAQADGNIGINGTYFCPPDYPQCEYYENSFDPPVYDAESDRIIGEAGIVFYDKPIIAQTSDGDLFYYHRGEDFPNTLAEFEQVNGQVTGLIGSWPSLIEGGETVLANEPRDQSYHNAGTRNGIGWDNDHIYLVSTIGATMDDLASVFETLNVNYAMNLDGGGSSAIHYYGTDVVGPGRLVPNALVFTER